MSGTPTPITVDFLANTCEASPSQWEGVTAPCLCCGHRLDVYARFRYGRLRIGVASGRDYASDEDRAVFLWQAPADRVSMSRMAYAELRELVPDWLTLPAAEGEVEVVEALG